MDCECGSIVFVGTEKDYVNVERKLLKISLTPVTFFDHVSYLFNSNNWKWGLEYLKTFSKDYYKSK